MASEKPAPSSQSFRQLLEKLQQDSWQLELLISGFALFLLLGAYEPLEELSNDASYLSNALENDFVIGFPIVVLFVGWFILIFNMFIHVLLRGLWISTIGLRYVSGEIEYDELKYAPRFKQYLQRRIGTFDRYIELLENLCSVVFAFTFLLVFVFISFCLFILAIGLMANGFNEIEDYIITPAIGKIVTRVIGISFLLSGIIYMIDFLTLGFIKRIRWFSGVYMPIYRLMSTVTLSFLYRPMYYNLIDNKFGRRIGLVMIPYSIILLVLASLYYETHIYFPDERKEHLTFYNDHYEDLRSEEELIESPLIPSKFISNNFLEFFIPYWPIEMDSVIYRICPDLIPDKKTKLYTGVIQIDNDDRPSKEIKAKSDSTFQCLAQSYQIIVNDSLFESVHFWMYTHPNQSEKGLKAVLDVNYLSRGEHQLTINRRAYRKREDQPDSLYWKQDALIPFWLE